VELDLALLADDAKVDERGKLFIIGEFRYLTVTAIPARHGHLAVVARFIALVSEVRDRANFIQVALVDEDGGAIMPRSPKIPLAFGITGPADRGMAQAQLILALDGLEISKLGTHRMDFWVNDQFFRGPAFFVTEVPKPEPPKDKPVAG